MGHCHHRKFSSAALAAVLLASGPTLLEAAASQAAGEEGEPSIELVDPKVLRVCADPHNLPFSNEQGQGFENKLAEFLASKLGKSLSYTWYPQAPGFVRNTLAALKCDVIIGYPQGNDLVQSTNPYYRTSYAVVFKPTSGLDGIESLADPRLKTKRIGVVAGTPPSTFMATAGLMANAKPYPLVVDTRFDSSTANMVKDLTSGEIDVGVLWGPIAGYYAKASNAELAVVPLTRQLNGPPLIYRIAMGVRFADQDWKRLLNKTIAENQGTINHILLEFGVPLLDETNEPITEAAPVQTTVKAEWWAAGVQRRPSGPPIASARCGGSRAAPRRSGQRSGP